MPWPDWQRKLAITTFATMWLIAMLSGLLPKQSIPEWVMAIWMLCMAACLLVGIFSWRCPQCGYFIAGRFSQVRYCWKCGIRFS